MYPANLNPGMDGPNEYFWLVRSVCFFVGILCTALPIDGQKTTESKLLSTGEIVAIEGTLKIYVVHPDAGGGTWESAQLKQRLYPGDRLKTGTRSRATIILSDGFTVSIGPNSEASCLVPDKRKNAFFILRGILIFFNREDAGE